MSTHDPAQVRETIRAFINASIAIDGLSDDENLFESGVANSLFAIELTTFIEREFGVEIGMDDLAIDNFKSVNAAADFVARKEGKK